MGTELAVIDPVYSCKSVDKFPPTVEEFIRKWFVDAGAFINQGVILGK